MQIKYPARSDRTPRDVLWFRFWLGPKLLPFLFSLFAGTLIFITAVTSLPARADTASEARDLQNARNQYFEQIASGKAKTSEQIKELQTTLISPASQRLREAQREQLAGQIKRGREQATEINDRIRSKLALKAALIMAFRNSGKIGLDEEDYVTPPSKAGKTAPAKKAPLKAVESISPIRPEVILDGKDYLKEMEFRRGK